MSAGASHFKMSPLFWTSLEIFHDDRWHSTMQSATTSYFFFFFSVSPHFQFHLQFLLLSSCLAITLCPSLPLYFLMEMFYIWSASSTFMDVCPSSSLKRIRQQLVWDWGQMSVWETVTLWLGQLVNHGHHSNLKKAQCKPLCISAALTMTCDFIPWCNIMVTMKLFALKYHQTIAL